MIASVALASETLKTSIGYWRMLTAREMIRPIVTSETSDCKPIKLLAVGVSGSVSVGLNAAALVSDTYR